MTTLQSFISQLIGWLLFPFLRLNPLWPLLLLSLVMTLAFLLAFRRLTSPSQVQAVKNRLQAHLLELRLFKDSPRILFSALGNILVYNARYLSISLKPILVLLAPIVVLLIHLDGWFGYRPLRTHEAAIVMVKVPASRPELVNQITLEVPPGIKQETPALRVFAAGEVSWSIRGKQAGSHRLIFRGPGATASKRVVVSNTGWQRVWPSTVAGGFWNALWNPGEAVLAPDGPVQEVTLTYPTRSIRLFGWEMHWLLCFFLASCLFGWVASRRMKVTI